MGMEKRGMRFLDEGREWRLPDLLYADDLVQCGESEENGLLRCVGEEDRKSMQVRAR